MNLVLHILRKDLRRHRWEVLLFVLSCAGWAWQLTNRFGPLARQMQTIAPVVFFGMWVLLTIRVVQGENLVGDREFWLTRPYRWHQLLAAKACFLFLCLNLPLVIVQLVLLKVSAIPLSSTLLPGLLFLQLEMAFYITFPSATLAALTESLVQWILTVLGLLVFALMVSWLPWNKLPATLAGQEDAASLIGMGLIAPVLAFALIWQYVRRRVWPARLAAGSVVVLVPFIMLIAPTHALLSLAYMHPEGGAPIHLSMAENGTDSGRTYTRYVREFGPESRIEIPVLAGSIDSNTLVNVDGWRVTLTGDGGWRWQSPWVNHTINITSDPADHSISFDMPTAMADQLAQKHATARVELAFSVFRLSPPQRVENTGARFTLPGGVTCGIRSARLELFFYAPSCAAPLRLPEVIMMQMQSDENTCSQLGKGRPLPPGSRATKINFGTSLPAEFDPNPVQRFDLSMDGWSPSIPITAGSKQNLPAEFCRGTPLTVRTGRSVDRMQAAFDLGSIGSEVPETESPDFE